MIDRAYLDSVGWKGIRQRKIHLEKMLRAAIASRGIRRSR
ncbi:MAG: class I SAM-dependent methyltransferase family protein [Thermoanaerobaculia bacterium]